MYSKYLETSCNPNELLKFQFKAIITCYYYDKLGNDYWERVLLEDIDISTHNTIGLTEDDLVYQLKKSFKNLPSENITQILENIKSESYSADPNYVCINPDFIIQSTGKKDIKGRLIFEGDIIEVNTEHYIVTWDTISCGFTLVNAKTKHTTSFADIPVVPTVIGNVFQDIGSVK